LRFMISRKIASASCVGGDNDVLEWEVAKRREMKPFLACKRERSGWKTRRKRRKTHLHRRVDEGEDEATVEVRSREDIVVELVVLKVVVAVRMVKSGR
jgi:hypothetical protein